MSKSGKRKKRLSFKEKLKVIQIQEDKCLVCGMDFNTKYNNWRVPQMHHIIPERNKGATTAWNIVALHEPCHRIVEVDLYSWTVIFVRHKVKQTRKK